MKTKTTYPKKAKRAKAILVGGLILIQASLIAGDSSGVKQELANTSDSYYEYSEIPIALNAANAYYYLNEVAFEAEFEMCLEFYRKKYFTIVLNKRMFLKF